MRAFAKIALNIGCVAVLLSAFPAAAFAAEPAPPPAPHQTPQQLVDALYAAFGDHHDRAVHAKGIFLEGSFEPTTEAASLSKATLFSSGKLDLVARFSNFTGIPDIPDPSANANPRGFALQFYLPDDTQTDIVSHSFNGFPVATADEFGVFLRAIASSGPGATAPTALDQFLATHPIAKTFVTTQKPAPDSFATLPYFGVNAFKFTAADGKTTFVRYRFVPQAGEHFVSAEDLKTKGNDYLLQEIAERVKTAPVKFDWYAQLSGKGDVIDNPSVAWPETNKLVKLGTITLTTISADQPTVSRMTSFQPERLPKGIDAADPMLDARQAAYPLSFHHRQ